MNKSRYPFLLASWLALAQALMPALRAQETPPAPPPAAEPAAPAEPATTPPEKADKTDVAAPAEEPKVAPEEKKPEGELRELGASEEKPTSAKKRAMRSRSGHHDGPRIGNQTVASGSTQSEMVTLGGDTVVDGHVTDAAVSVFGLVGTDIIPARQVS